MYNENCYNKNNLKALKTVQSYLTDLIAVENDCISMSDKEGVDAHTEKQKIQIQTLENINYLIFELEDILNVQTLLG